MVAWSQLSKLTTLTARYQTPSFPLYDLSILYQYLDNKSYLIIITQLSSFLSGRSLPFVYLYRSRRGCSTIPLQILERPRHQGGCADLFFVYCENLFLVTVWLRFLGLFQEWHRMDTDGYRSNPGKYLIGYIELIRQKFLNFSLQKC